MTSQLDSLNERRPRRKTHPILGLILNRIVFGVITIAAVGVIVFWATTMLPGNAATAVLGQSATPERIAQLEQQLNLDQPLFDRFIAWVTDALSFNFGSSLVTHEPVLSMVAPRLVNTGVLLAITTVLSSIIGVVFGAIAAARKDGWFDQVGSVFSLVVSAIPEFVVGIFVILLFSVSVFHWFPAVAVIPPGQTVLTNMNQIVLPVLTLVLVVTPYVFRMMRAATIEALGSEYAELAELKGMSPKRVLFRHALPNAMAPTVQVIGLNILYLAGGVVLVESVFNYQGIGFTLVNAVNTRDIPIIQFVVLALAAFYVVLNITTDLVVLAMTPRRRKAA
ncbi:ABC transporter permease [Leucobacter sp. GX24907]